VSCKLLLTAVDRKGWASSSAYHRNVPEPTTSPANAPAASPSDAPHGSPLARALDRVGDRWSLLVVEALLDGPRRFGELAEVVTGIAPNILTDRLRRLERAGILRSTPYQERPTRFAYDLTADGRDLASAVRLLADWGSSGGDVEPLRHAACGTPLEARWFCPTCTTMVDAADAPEERYL
jgi:DNA-binding HxlR family transcriptional regulator